MKKIILFLSLVLIVTGCNKQEKIKKEESTTEIIEEEPLVEYIDYNSSKIGLYLEKGNRLELIEEYKTNISNGVDIGIFDIYPSQDNEVILTSGFGNSFYNSWISLENYQNLKIGFNIKYTLSDGTDVSYNILDPKVIYKEIYNYLYDDYKNRYSSWYSHIEEDEYNSETLFTSIKLYAADVDSISSKISLTVFTYDDLEDFDEEGNYRGNSSYSITICDKNKTC